MQSVMQIDSVFTMSCALLRTVYLIISFFAHYCGVPYNFFLFFHVYLKNGAPLLEACTHSPVLVNFVALAVPRPGDSGGQAN